MNWTGYESSTYLWNTPPPSDEVNLPRPTSSASSLTVVALQEPKISAGVGVSSGKTLHKNIPCSGTGRDLEVSFTMINIKNEAFVENVRITNGGTGYTIEEEKVTTDNFNKDKSGEKYKATFTAKVNLGFITPNEPKMGIKRIFTNNTNKFTYTNSDDGSRVQCPDLPESTIEANDGVIWQRRFSTQYNGYYYYTIDSANPKFSWEKPPT